MNREPVPDPGTDDVDVLWLELQEHLAEHLAGMADPKDEALVRVELLVGEEGGCGPYVQVISADAGRALHAEISSDHYLQPQYHLGAFDTEQLGLLGWTLAPQGNWEQVFAAEDAAVLAEMAVLALRRMFGVPHPQLLSVAVHGRGADVVQRLGLTPSVEVRSEADGDPVAGIGTSQEPPAVAPADRDELVAMVRQTLAATMGEEPEVDGDGDFVVYHHGHPFYVRVLPDQPAVMMFALVVQGVRSRQGAAGQLAVLNAKTLWTSLQLAERDVWLRVVIPAMPFAPEHLRSMMGVAQTAFDEVRADLALQTGGRAA